MGAPTVYSEDWGKVDESVEEVLETKVTEETPKVESAKTEEPEISE